METLEDYGVRIPQQMSVVGFGDAPKWKRLA
ncbi:MAG: hypothetical protein F9K27_11285 [Anaerolineae bacterium]|nr:MAG: hypothetical protein F9K27_11285 [Anaerolineae bacterium]